MLILTNETASGAVDELLGQSPIEDKDAEDAPEFEWNAGNEAHLARHGITPEEVEELFTHEHVWTRNRKNRAGQSAVYGRANSGRPLVIIVVITENDRIRPITGWDLSPSLQRRFLK